MQKKNQNMFKTQFIIYVSDQERSTRFYSLVLGKSPVLNVPGMTEFQLSEYTKLGLMPEKSIRNILLDSVPDPSSGNGVPRCEIYLYVNSPAEYLERAVSQGAVRISGEESRDWGDSVAYCADQDGHVLAFARTPE